MMGGESRGRPFSKKKKLALLRLQDIFSSMPTEQAVGLCAFLVSVLFLSARDNAAAFETYRRFVGGIFQGRFGPTGNTGSRFYSGTLGLCALLSSAYKVSTLTIYS